MSEQSDILQKELEKLSADLTERYEQLGMRASGKFDREKTVTVSETNTGVKGKIEGALHTTQLQFGRRPGKFPPLAAIEQWIRDKGIVPDIPIRSLAYLIARKIAKEGWKREGYGGVELISSVVTPERIDNIIAQVGIVNVDAIVSGFVKELEAVEA